MITYLAFYLTLIINVLFELNGMITNNSKAHKAISTGNLAKSVIS